MSANGTWINQTTKLARGGRRLLNSGDEIALLNPHKAAKRADASSAGGADSGREAGEDGERLLEAEDATFTFVNLDDRCAGVLCVCVCVEQGGKVSKNRVMSPFG